MCMRLTGYAMVYNNIHNVIYINCVYKTILLLLIIITMRGHLFFIWRLSWLWIYLSLHLHKWKDQSLSAMQREMAAITGKQWPSGCSKINSLFVIPLSEPKVGGWKWSFNHKFDGKWSSNHKFASLSWINQEAVNQKWPFNSIILMGGSEYSASGQRSVGGTNDVAVSNRPGELCT